ncbi:TBC1 domain family member 4 [Liparis tanakae]|uniref:TBC1 domain family member 4 n=1 Tax=Liparis tanakae TaxID=230148 RepID=A0A4Z2HPV2_9TELE|nr:TBC1 domain family member 4 [Liparis tanakae]
MLRVIERLSEQPTVTSSLARVGRFEVNLISPDSKSVVLEKNFKDISSCCQGVKQSDHFGFICRDHAESGPGQYGCYVFQCASESLVSLYPPRAKLAIQKYLSQLTDNEQAEIFERVQRLKPGSDQEENELAVLYLRQLCGSKQKSHLHTGEAPQNAANSSLAGDGSATSSRFKLDILKNKARSSLTSSLENIFARGASRMRGRLGSMGSLSSFERVRVLKG